MERDKLEDVRVKRNQYMLERALLFGWRSYSHQNIDGSRTERLVTSPTRLEVIDKTGRVYVNNDCNFDLEYQDDFKTLKIFIK